MSLECNIVRKLPARALAWSVALVFSFCLSTPPCLAQDEGAMRELEAGRRHVEQLTREAEELDRAGKHDKADVMRKKAADLMARIEEGVRKLEKGERQRHQRERLHQVLEGLERGMEALRMIRQHDALEMLERIAVKVRREIEEDEHARRKKEEQAKVRRHVELVRIAVKTLVEAGKKEGAHLLEHTLHAHELRSAGRDDPEAKKIIESAPSWEHNVKLLRLAAEILKKHGRKERSAQINELAGHILERHRKDAPQVHLEQAMQRIEALEQKVSHLTGAVEKLMQELRERR